MPEEQLFKAETPRTRAQIVETLRETADEIETGTVTLDSVTDSRPVDVPETATFEVELERMTDSETGTAYYELEYELSWTD